MNTARYCASQGRRSAGPGFTLVELQISLLLMSLITLVLISTLRLSIQTWAKVTGHQEQAEHAVLISQAIRRHASNMRLARMTTSDEIQVKSFFGNDEQIHFVAPFPTYQQNNDLYWWNLKTRWNDETETSELLLSYREFSDDQRITYLVDGSLIVEEETTEEDGGAGEFEEVVTEEFVIGENLELTSVDYVSRTEAGEPRHSPSNSPGDQIPDVIVLQISSLDRSGELTPWQEIAVVPGFARQQILGYAYD